MPMRLFMPVLLAAFGLVALTARADQTPQRKPGLWEITMSSGDAAAPRIGLKMCIDAATDAALRDYAMGVGKRNCSKNDVKSDGKEITTDAVCTVAGKQMISHSITKFSGDTAYHTDVETRYEPPMRGETAGTAMQDGKWTGPCPAHVQPGEMIAADGSKMYLKEMTGR
jgi:hypothetical protein